MQLFDSPHAELWTPVPGYEGLYSASSHGRVRSEQRTVVQQRGDRQVSRPVRSRILILYRDKKGYLFATLSNCGVAKKIQVHRIVCHAFHGSPFEGAHAAHLNGNPSDNKSDNLAWVTHAENSKHKTLHGSLNGKKNPNARVNEQQVAEIRATRGVGQRALAERFGISASQIRNIQKGVSWKSDKPLDVKYLATHTFTIRRKLTRKQVSEIRQQPDVPDPVLAKLYGVSSAHISAVQLKKFWR